MKRLLAALTVVVLGAGTAMAAGPVCGHGTAGGPGAAGGCMDPAMTGPNAAAYKKFIGDTMTLRQEMMNKHFDLQKEYIKDKPDTAVIAKLQGEVAELRTKIMDARTKAGITMGPKGQKGHKGHSGHKGHGMMKGGMGGNMMMDCPHMAAPPVPPAK